MSVASCWRTHQSWVPMGMFFQARARIGTRKAETAEAPTFRNSRRVGCVCIVGTFGSAHPTLGRDVRQATLVDRGFIPRPKPPGGGCSLGTGPHMVER